MKKILVCGIGNKLRRDDGIGSYVIERLEKLDFFKNSENKNKIELRDFGCGLINCLLEFGDYERIIIIDAIKSEDKKRKIIKQTFNLNDNERLKDKEAAIVSLHEHGIKEVLHLLQRMGNCPKQVTILGCEAKDLSVGIGLTNKIKKQATQIIKLVLKELNLNN